VRLADRPSVRECGLMQEHAIDANCSGAVTADYTSQRPLLSLFSCVHSPHVPAGRGAECRNMEPQPIAVVDGSQETDLAI
jgi:hypothetical protein